MDNFFDHSSRKFWRISRQGSEVAVPLGRIGTKGQSQLEQFPSDQRAQREAQKLVAEKVEKGYVEESLPQSRQAGSVP